MINEIKKNILVTGAAGFIGYHLCEALLKLGYNVTGLDNINSYYDVNLKFDRLKELGVDDRPTSIFNRLVTSNIYGENFQFIRMNLEDREALPKLFESHKFDLVCNLAAQAGVRYSIENPEAYLDSNVSGFLNVLECCRNHQVKKLLYASSSSVYGNSDNVPFNEEANVDNPISLYAATKKSNELMAFTYSHLYQLETIGLRFFTVYGPWGRPDMAMFLFTNAILNNKPIKVFNNGDLSRDFTFIDDIINGVLKIICEQSKNNNSLYKIYNIGNSKPEKLLDFINAIENVTGVIAKKEMLPMQKGDVYKTWANVESLKRDYGYKSETSIVKGVTSFIKWYKSYYRL